MRRVILSILLLLTAGGAFAEELIKPKVKDVPFPRYPEAALRANQDGWVVLEFTVTIDGRVHDPVVTGAYPKGVFERTTLATVPSWEFTPFMRDGVPIEGRHQFYVAFQMEGHNGISPSSLALFQKAMKALGAADAAAEGDALEKIGAKFDAGKLNISEAARYHAMLTSYKRRKGDFAGAIATSETAIMLSKYLDNKKVVDLTHLERVASYVGLGQADDAVDYFDSWRKESDAAPAPAFVEMIEKLRAGGAGKGKTFNILSYGEISSRGK